jgi:uncharacterized glyoxalase superfamily protein PhnB
MTDAAAMPAPTSGVTPYLSIDGALKAVEFYKAAFGAEVAMIMPPDSQGRTMHAHLIINGGSVMLSDFFPEYGHTVVAPAAFNIALEVTDADAVFNRAVEAGATPTSPLADMFWGARYGQLRDPFGLVWAINQPLKPAA